MNLVIARDYERGKITSWGQLGAVKAAQGTNFYATTALRTSSFLLVIMRNLKGGGLGGLRTNLRMLKINNVVMSCL